MSGGPFTSLILKLGDIFNSPTNIALSAGTSELPHLEAVVQPHSPGDRQSPQAHGDAPLLTANDDHHDHHRDEHHDHDGHHDDHDYDDDDYHH